MSKKFSALISIIALSWIVLLRGDISFGSERDPERENNRHQLNVSIPPDAPKDKSLFKEVMKYPFRIFDGCKVQITSSHPKLTHVNHQVDFINKIANTNLRDWDSMKIVTFDIVLWKDLSKYFKIDLFH